MSSLVSDLDRIKIKGGTKWADTSKRVFVTPWESVSFYRALLSGGVVGNATFIGRIPKPPRRFKVSIGSIFACVSTPSQDFASPSISMLSLTLIDGRNARPVGIGLTFPETSVINKWRSGAGTSELIAGIPQISRIDLSFYPDGLLLMRDISPILLFEYTGAEDASASFWYRYEEWS